MTTIDATPELAALMRTWLATGRPGNLHRELLERMEPFGDQWLVGLEWVFRVVESEGRKTLEWERRSKVLTGRTEV
jgi:hypothetical protein